MAVDRLAEQAGAQPWRAKFQGEFTQVDRGKQRLLLLKPQTFMNRSGQSVQAAAQFYKLTPESILIVHDELDLPFGQLRLKQGGGDAGHNGLRSVTSHLGSNGYARLRLGIGRPSADFRGDVADYVLQGFPAADAASVSDLVERAVKAIELVASRGLEVAMNATNQRPKA